MSNNSAIGTPGSHYSPASDGPFLCAVCVHFRFPNQCLHPEVIEDAKSGAKPLRLNNAGNAVVERGGCCEYQRGRNASHSSKEE